MLPIHNKKQFESEEQYLHRLIKCKLHEGHKISWQNILDWTKCGLTLYKLTQYAMNLSLDYEDDIISKSKSKQIKCMILSDVHVPYQRDDLLHEIDKQVKEGLTHIIIAGDFFDNLSCSSFQSLKKPTLEEELISGWKIMKAIREIFKGNILTINGNHCERLERTICNMESHVRSYINPSMMDNLVQGFRIYDNGDYTEYDPIPNLYHTNHWFERYFDNLLIAHPKNYSVVPGKVSEQLAQHFMNRGIANEKDIVVFGHTHTFSCIKQRRAKSQFVIETPCFCKPASYADRGSLGMVGEVYGYTMLEFKEGELIKPIDFKFIFLD